MKSELKHVTEEQLYQAEEAARDLGFMFRGPLVYVEPAEDDSGVVVRDSREKYPREMWIQYHGDTKKDSLDKSKDIGKYIETVSPEFILSLVKEVERLREFESLAAHWKSNHESEVARARILKERPDMPVERVKAYDRMIELENENKRVRAEIDSMKDGVHTRSMLDMIFSQVMQNMQESQRTNRTLEQVFKVNGYY